ncbi:MAG: Spy/CpxP family protein refolding chaperone [Sulfuricella sp.]
MIAKRRVLPVLTALLLAGGAAGAHACDWYSGGYGYGGMGPGMMGMGYGMMGGMMGPGMMGPGMMGPGMMGGYGAGQGMPNLTEQQQNKMTQIQEEVRKKHWDLMGKMNDEQTKLQQLYYSGKSDSAAIEAQHKKIYQLQREMDESWLEAKGRMDAVLTKEQKERLRGGYGPGWMMR